MQGRTRGISDMTVLLGIDTGGTFTDAVVMTADTPHQVIAAAKRPTSHHDLSVGIGDALAAVLASANAVPDDVGLVSVSTTLATNALVEGQGDPVGVLALGFSAAELERAGLDQVVDSDAIVTLAGGHDAHGHELAALSDADVEAAVRGLAPRVSSLAVIGQFSVRNPAHERAVSAIARRLSSMPVTCSHELSSRLDGPRRALTAALNARLLAIGSRLVEAISQVMSKAAISAPLMIVRGDGSIVRASYAVDRPIETVFSGPAASVIGAQHLGGIARGLIVDVGGTTTDISVVRNANPRLATEGATVGGHRTMVAAIESTTIGLGGDSEVHVDTRASDGPLRIGPARAVPIGRLAQAFPTIVDDLRRQLAEPVGLSSHGRFVLAVADPTGDLDRREQSVMNRLASGPVVEFEAAPSALEGRALQRLRDRGVVRVAAFTPTDAVAVLGRSFGDASPLSDLDVDASTLAAEVMARQSGPTGGSIASSPAALAKHVVDLMQTESAAFLLQCALASDGLRVDAGDPLLSASLTRAVADLDANDLVTSVSIGMRDPIVAVGAPAPAFYPAVARLAGTSVEVPDYSHVANAVGAVVGRVQVRRVATVTQPRKGQFKVHLNDQRTFGDLDRAVEWARDKLSEAVTADATRAGAEVVELHETWQVKEAVVGDKTVFVEGILSIEASGKPSW